jgi:hypothetical protein
MAIGRPSSYTQELAAEICKRLAETEHGLIFVCEAEGMPAAGTVYEWLNKHAEFADMYARARDRQADRFAAESLRIADTAIDANLARLRVDTRKWAASKLAPKKYGDRITNEQVGDGGGPVIFKTVYEGKP